MKKRYLPLLCGVLLVCLCGCVRSRFQGVDFEVYIPPTLMATQVSTPTLSPITPVPTNIDYTCRPYLSYVEDVTVEDGSVFSPGDEITKTWRIRNDGDCAWTDKYSLRFVDGDNMGVEDRQPLPTLQPEEEGELTIVFTAPGTQGSYWTDWQAYDALGNAFGDDVYMEIYVDPYHTVEEDGGQ